MPPHGHKSGVPKAGVNKSVRFIYVGNVVEYEIKHIKLGWMATTLVNPMPPFDPDAEIGVNFAPKWKIWLQDFEMYLVASGVTDKKKKRALILYQAGPRVREIFRQIPDHGDDDDFDTAVNKLNAYFEPQKHRL